MLSMGTRLKLLSRVKLHPTPLVTCNGSVFIIGRQMNYENDGCCWYIRDVEEVLAYFQEPNDQLTWGERRKPRFLISLVSDVTEILAECPARPREKMHFEWRQYLRHQRAASLLYLLCDCILSCLSQDDGCWSKGRVSLNSISSRHTLVWTDGLTDGTRQ